MNRGLRDHLTQKAASMRAAAEAMPAGTEWHETVEATCVADDATGVRKVRMRDWQLIGDSGPAFGGWGLGPSSPEMLCAVISTCLTHTYLIGAATLGIPLDRVEVQVTADNNDARFLDIETTDPPIPFHIRAVVTLEAEGVSPADKSRLHRYAERCPLTNLVRNSNIVTVTTRDSES
jgi:uncharacterized OsmC-like protein